MGSAGADRIGPSASQETQKAVKVFVPKPAAVQTSTSGILVEGVGNLLTKMAKCCLPAPPDTIVGYVTRDHGVTIHRKDCAGMLRLPESQQGRMLSAQWGSSTQGDVFTVDISVEAYDRQGLLRDIGDLFVREKVNVTRVNTISKNNQANMQFSVEISDLNQLNRLLSLILQVPSVVSARRHI